MNNLCPVHNCEFKTIPAGVSRKTGKPYKSFEVCPVEGCREKPQQEKPQESVISEQISPMLKDIEARLDGIEANQQRIIKGIAMVLNAVKENVITEIADGQFEAKNPTEEEKDV